jgi:glucose-1-phosphate cytidylyltransferase
LSVELSSMKTVILAGGLGTRMQELTNVIPKPMIQVGGKPILWHIMKIFSAYGVSKFDIALGYKSDVIKSYFLDYSRMENSISVDLQNGTVKELESVHEDWVVDLIETGESTQTGGRIARMKDYLGSSRFFLTYGDGVGDIDIAQLLEFHLSHGKIATVTAVRPPARFGALEIDYSGRVTQFTEKPVSGETYINGGFFVFQKEIFDYLSTNEDCILERAPLEKLTRDGELRAYRHDGFWQSMDTLRDVNYMNRLWKDGGAPWKVWS